MSFPSSSSKSWLHIKIICALKKKKVGAYAPTSRNSISSIAAFIAMCLDFYGSLPTFSLLSSILHSPHKLIFLKMTFASSHMYKN